MINMRIQQWSLFREDIRDLFNLTTSHMSTYMVVGTLFLGYSVSHMWYITTFPEDPPWLKFFWMNCFISAMCYGFLAVWLAMHGAIAAQSASVQLLTRAIRPPYPSASELGSVRHELANYEASGPLKFFSPPKFAGRSGSSTSANSSALAERGQSSVQASGTEGPVEDQRGNAFDGPSSKHPAGLPSPWEFAPGLSAEMGMLQETFLPFDAYARVCLMTGVSNVVTAFSYFWIAHQDWTHEGSFLAALGGSCLLMFTTLVLYKLDLYVEKRRLWIFKSVVLCAPIVSMASLITWRKGQGWQAVHALTEWVLVCSTCLMHICWLALFVWEARPSKENLDLPLSFRSVRYLDVFSSLRKRQTLQRQMASSASRRRRASVSENSEEMGAVEHLSADYIFHLIRELLNACEHSQSLLSEEEVRCLQLAKARLLERGMSPDAEPQGHGHEGLWLQRVLENDLGQPVLYFVNTKTLDVMWTDPPISQQLFFEDLDMEIRRLVDPAGESLAGDVILGQETSDDLQQFEIAGSEAAEGPSVPAAQQPLVPTLRRPGSSHGQSSMPWKYFLQISSMILCVWVVTTLYCMINVGREAGRATLFQGKAGPWPHDFFAPSALACHGQQVLLGDRFTVYPGRIDQEGLSMDDAIFSTLEGHGFEWGAIAARSAQHLFLLQRDGHAIHEFFDGALVQRWEVSLADAVHAMSLLSADLARQHCQNSAASEPDIHPWAILAAAGHDVVILCPRSHGSHGTLYPRRWLPQAASEHATVALQMPSREHLWLLRSQTVANQAEKSAKVWLVREHLQSGHMDNFALPKDRSWAPGLCIRNSSLLLAAYHPRDKSPEIWHLETIDS
ncbi:unnamed protein product [Cladocopium goreaui]|uniref:Uncharacterized protein n=1 Tax=Cladocopium goreaui TaxID=2562237 RepID=A0A9P1DD52_9DINO|nr:unnamed protein product [Cladocopium goreaui]